MGSAATIPARREVRCRLDGLGTAARPRDAVACRWASRCSRHTPVRVCHTNALSDLIRASRSTCCQQRTLARTLVLQVAVQRWWCARLAARASCCASASARSGQRHCRADLSSHVRVHVALTSTRQHATCQLGSIDNPMRPQSRCHTRRFGPLMPLSCAAAEAFCLSKPIGRRLRSSAALAVSC